MIRSTLFAVTHTYCSSALNAGPHAYLLRLFRPASFTALRCRRFFLEARLRISLSGRKGGPASPAARKIAAAVSVDRLLTFPLLHRAALRFDDDLRCFFGLVVAILYCHFPQRRRPRSERALVAGEVGLHTISACQCAPEGEAEIVTFLGDAIEVRGERSDGWVRVTDREEGGDAHLTLVPLLRQPLPLGLERGDGGVAGAAASASAAAAA